MLSFSERYEAACQRDGTLRARRTDDGCDLRVRKNGKWEWIAEDDRYTEREPDAIAHATVAMLRWLLLIGELQIGDRWSIEGFTPPGEIELHDCLIAAVEKVLDAK